MSRTSFAMSVAGTVLAACAVLGACRSGVRPTDGPVELPLDEGGDFALTASVGGGMHFDGVRTAVIRVAGDGATTVEFEYDMWGGGKVTQRMTLGAADLATLRASVERSDFFGTWPTDPSTWVTDQDTWVVRVRDGARTGSRSIYAETRFDETERFLWRAIHQAVAECALATEHTDVLADIFQYDGSAARVLHIEPIVDGLREAALRGRTPAFQSGALVTLRSLVSADEFASLLHAALEGADDARRQAILAPLVDRGAIALPLRRSEVVLPYALAEMERSWRDWDSKAPGRAQFLRDCASALVVCHEVRAVPTFERMVVELSTPERPLALAPLAAMGDAAIDSLVRLASSPRPEVRCAAAEMCEGLASELTSPSACARPPGADPSRALAPFREHLVPRLEVLAEEPAGGARLQHAASMALVAIGARKPPPGWEWHRLDWN